MIFVAYAASFRYESLKWLLYSLLSLWSCFCLYETRGTTQSEGAGPLISITMCTWPLIMIIWSGNYVEVLMLCLVIMISIDSGVVLGTSLWQLVLFLLSPFYVTALETLLGQRVSVTEFFFIHFMLKACIHADYQWFQVLLLWKLICRRRSCSFHGKNTNKRRER